MIIDQCQRFKTRWRRVYHIFGSNCEDFATCAGNARFPICAYECRRVCCLQREKSGKVCKIRGQAYVTKVTPSLAYRMIDAAKKMLHGYIADVYITVDQRKGDAGGK